MSQYIEKIYSKVKPELLLHQIIRKEIFNDANFRIDLSAPEKYLQIAVLNLKENQTFKPHKHIIRDFATDDYHAEESWICIEGQFKAILYDIDDTIITESVLNPGDLSMTYGPMAGHNYVSLKDNSKIYEVKVGQYLGVKYDKIMI